MIDCNDSTISAQSTSSIAVSVLMMRTHRKSELRIDYLTLIIVEGDSDKEFYGKFFNVNTCLIQPVCGKKRVIDVCDQLLDMKERGFFGIVDDDFSSIDGSKSDHSLIFYTDTHDIETLVIFSPALSRFFKHIIFTGYEDKINLKNFTTELLCSLFDIGYIVGCLRYLSIKKDWNFDFDNIRFSNFIDCKNLRVNKDSLVYEILDVNKDVDIEFVDVLRSIKEVENYRHDPTLICQGHDLLEILLVVVPETLKSQSIEVRKKFDYFPRQSDLQKELFQHYEDLDFRKTKICRDVLHWEKTNKPYVVFPWSRLVILL